MYIDYEEFKRLLNERLKLDDDELYYDLLVKVVQKPKRYTGIFRASNPQTKLLQNVTQSREIKFGDFMEDIMTLYISKMGYQNHDKSIGTDADGNALSADQVFTSASDDKLYLVEQKIRDDHDSTKKRGQYDNFRKKFELLASREPTRSIVAIMWFIDDSLTKNKNYYEEQARKNGIDNVQIHILYGEKLFEVLEHLDVWKELCAHLQRNKQERNDEILEIPDFGQSPIILKALRRLKLKEPSLYKKLISDKPEYIQLRIELFSNGSNLSNC